MAMRQTAKHRSALLLFTVHRGVHPSVKVHVFYKGKLIIASKHKPLFDIANLASVVNTREDIFVM